MYPNFKWIGTNSSYIQTKLGQIVITSITILLTLYTPMHHKYNIMIYIKLNVGTLYLYCEIVNNKNNNNIGNS